MTKKEELLALIQKLQLPLLPADKKELVNSLSEEEAGNLAFVYRAFLKQQQAVDNALKKTSPGDFQQIEQEYRQKQAEIENEYLDQMEAMQKNDDESAEEEDRKMLDQLEKKVETLEKEKEKAIGLQDNLLKILSLPD